MSLLKIDLQDGFLDDTVIIRLDRAEVFRKDGVRTRRQIGLADSVEVEPDSDAAEVDVELPRRAIRQTIRVDTSTPAYLAVSLKDDGTIDHRISREPFGYV